MATAFAVSDVLRQTIKTDEFEMYLNEAGIIRVLAIGFWKVDAVARYFTALDALILEARRHFGRALVLVDKRGAPIQSAEVADRLNAGCLHHYKSTDRLAVVVSTSLAKLQVKRVLPGDRTSAFVSIPAAEHYLLTS